MSRRRRPLIHRAPGHYAAISCVIIMPRNNNFAISRDHKKLRDPVQSEREVMSDIPEVEDERPCLHCLIGDLIDEYYGEYGSPSGESDVIDVGEIMTSVAKIVAEITSGSDAVEGRRIVEELSREISKFDAEYRDHAATGTSGFDVRH
jgi:hypothetical protein